MLKRLRRLKAMTDKKNMPAINNLKPISTKEEARERGRQGGLKSALAKKEAKAFKEIIIERLSQLEKDGRSTKEVLIKKLVDRILKDDVKIPDLIKALEFLQQTTGESVQNEIESKAPQINIIVANEYDKQAIEDI